MFGIGCLEFLLAGCDEIELLLDVGVVGCGWYCQDVSAELIDFAEQLLDVETCSRPRNRFSSWRWGGRGGRTGCGSTGLLWF
jgi:hypothetical protein